MNRISTILALSLFLGSGPAATAAPPEVTSLFPAGAQAGTSASVTVQGKLGDGTRTWCSTAGVTVTLPEKPGPITVQVGPQVEPGLCWLRFYNDEGATGLRPFIIGQSREVLEQEPNDEVAKAQPLSDLPLVLNGQHGKGGDADTYAISLKKGQVLVASLIANSVLGSPQDSVLQILGPNGFVIEQNEDDRGLDPQIAFPVPADGTYYLRTWAFPAAPDSSIRLFGSPACVYRLTVTTGPFVDHLFPASVQAGLTQSIRVSGWNLPDVEIPMEPPVSAIQQRFNWPVPGYSHRLPATVMVQPYPSVVEVEPNDLAHPQSVSVPVSITGRIATLRDVDAYQVSLKKGQRVRLEVIARDAGSPLDPVVRIYDGTGKVLKEADDDGKQSADPDIEFIAPADGEFRITVTDRFLHHGDRFSYLLSLTEPQPEFSLSVAADAFVLKPASELEIPVTINRTSGFAEPIRVLIPDLPAGVTADAVVSEPKGDSAKSVKLKLKSEGDAHYAGPLQIVGQTTGGMSPEKKATTSLKAFQADPAHLWLTVIPKK